MGDNGFNVLSGQADFSGNDQQDFNATDPVGGVPDVAPSSPDIPASNVPTADIASNSTPADPNSWYSGANDGPQDPNAVVSQAPVAPANAPISWRDVLRGALVGMSGAASVKGRGSFGGGLVGGAGAELNDQQQQVENANKQKLIQMQQQRQDADIKFQNLQAAHLVVQTRIADQQLHALPQEEQDTHNEASIKTMNSLAAMGLTPTVVIPNNKGGKEATAALAQQTATNGSVPPMFTLNLGDKVVGYDLNQLGQAPQGLTAVNNNRHITNPGAPDITQQQFQQMDPTMRNTMLNNALSYANPLPDEGTLLRYQNDLETIKAQPDSPEKTENLNMVQGIVNRMQTSLDSAKSRADQQKAASISATGTAEAGAAGQKAAATGELQKNLSEANKNNQGTDANGQPEWKPKVSADEKKKAELAENIAENANAVNQILASRPDLVGKLAGRETSVAQLMGNNDKDISALATRIHNIAMANSGVHGFRSQEGVEATEKNLLNNFKNGATAVQGALKATTDSTQTFIDNARPSSYQTHSSQGGAYGYYQKQNPPQQTTGHQVGDVIVQNGKNFTVTSVDANGKVTGAK